MIKSIKCYLYQTWSIKKVWFLGKYTSVFWVYTKVELLPKSICSKNFITSCQIRRAFGDRSRRACGNSHLYFFKIRESFEGIKVKKNAVRLGKICTRCARNVGLFPCPGNSPFERIINIHATSGARTLAKKNNLAAVAGMYNFQPIFHALCPK